MRPMRGQPRRQGQGPALLRADSMDMAMTIVVGVGEVFLQAVS
jgi:hypothetical protein